MYIGPYKPIRERTPFNVINDGSDQTVEKVVTDFN